MISSWQRYVAIVAILLLGTIVTATSALHANCSASDPMNTCIRIGYFRWVPVPGAVQAQVITGYNEMIDWYIDRINKTKGGFLHGFPVEFIPYVIPLVSAAAADVSSAAARWVPTGGGGGSKKVDFVILPPGSNWAQATGGAMLTFENAHVPSIAANSPLSSLYQCPSSKTADLRNSKPCVVRNSRRFQYAHGISNAGEQYFQPWVGLLKLKKAKTIAIIQTGAATSIYPGVTQGILSAAADYAIDVVYVTNTTLINTNQIAQGELDRIVKKLIELNPDGVALATVACAPWIAEFKRVDYMPKALATVLCTDNDVTVTALGENINFVVGTAQWDPNMNGNDYLEDQDEQPWALFPHKADGRVIGQTSPMQFVKLWQRITTSSILPGYAEASILSAFTMLEGAIELTMRQGSLVPDPVLVNQQLQLYYQPSFFGILSTNRYGENQQKALVMNQRDATGVLGVISPASSATFDFIYPAPKFSERIYTPKMLNTTIEVIVIILLCLASVCTLALMGYLFKNRKQQVFQAAGLPFYLLMGFGCVTAYGSVLTWGVENNEQTCQARIWIWTICFHMFVAPLLASSWRISRIFSQKLQTVKLTNRTVGIVSLAIFAPQLLINIIWQSIAPLKPQIITSEILRPAFTSFTTCSGGHAGLIFTGATLAYSTLLLALACYLAYKIRKAYKLFNDARPIAMSMYIFTVTAAIILVIQIALNADDVSVQKVLFGLRSIGVIVAYQSSLALLYLRRILGQVEVTKYGGGGGQLNDESDDTSASPQTTGTKGVATINVKRPGGIGELGGIVRNANVFHRTPKVSNEGKMNDVKTRAPKMSNNIIHIAAATPLPSQLEFDALNHSQMWMLLQQSYEQMERLQTQLRMYNPQATTTAAAAHTREDVDVQQSDMGERSQNQLLPGTPSSGHVHNNKHDVVGDAREQELHMSIMVGGGTEENKVEQVAE